MKKNRFILASLALISFLLVSCASEKLNKDDLMPYQKKADIYLVNQDYPGVNAKMTELSKRYEGFVRKVNYHSDEKQSKSSDFEILVPFTYFNDFIFAVQSFYGDQIKKVEIGTEESLMRQYNDVKDKIESKKLKYKEISEKYNKYKDLDDKIAAKYELERADKDLDDLQQERLSLIESMNYSVIKVHWKEQDTIIQEEPIAGFPPPGDFINHPDIPPLAGREAVRDIVFTEYNQIETFGIDEPVRVKFIGLDPKKTDLITKLDLENGVIAMKTVPMDKKGIIKIDKRCQIVNVGPGPLPQVVLGPDVADEQIVITPRISNDNKMIGYEIRAGSVESGCSGGKANLNKFYQYKKVKPTKKQVTKPVKKKPVQHYNDLDWFYRMP